MVRHLIGNENHLHCHVSKYSLTYTHDASVVICERHLIGNENHSHSAMLVSTHCHHGHTARHLNANENDSHSAIMGTQRAPHVSKYSLTYNHAGCVGIC